MCIRDSSRPLCRGPSRTRARTAGPAMSPSSGPTVLTGPAAVLPSTAEASVQRPVRAVSAPREDGALTDGVRTGGPAR
eukprot:3252246-Alexandrium_andersonii.AAC.1